MLRRTLARRSLLAAGGLGALGHVLGASAATSSAAAPAAAAARGIRVEKDVATGKGGDTTLHCDIYRPPAGTEKRMAVVHFHGGAFAGGNKEAVADKVNAITSLGYVAIAAQYRLSGVARWPAQIEDAATQVRWARDNAARLGIDPAHIAVAGFASGGTIALHTAGQPDLQLAACVAYYPATDLTKYAKTLLPEGSDEAAIRAASPLARIREDFPPTVIFHGLADVAVPPESSQRLLDALRAAKVPAELHTFHGVPHEFDIHREFSLACATLADFFLERNVLHPKIYPPFPPPRQP